MLIRDLMDELSKYPEQMPVAIKGEIAGGTKVFTGFPSGEVWTEDSTCIVEATITAVCLKNK